MRGSGLGEGVADAVPDLIRDPLCFAVSKGGPGAGAGEAAVCD